MANDDIKVTDKRGQTKEEPTHASTSEHEHVHGENCNHDHDQGHASPEISFSSLIISLGTSAMIHMGLMDNPHTKQKDKNLGAAREEIELISMLQDKTKGNLDDNEKKIVEQVLYELRLRFVEASK